MYYYLIVALQGYCIYHCYANRNEYYWMFVIFFVPVLGSIIYLFVNVFQKRDLDKVQENITAVINPTKKITDLEKKLKFSNSFENQVALADAYLEVNMHDKAIENYEASLKDVFENDFYVISKLEEAYYFSSQFDKAIETAEKIINNTKFTKSRAAFLYALAMEKRGDVDKAKDYLITFDAPYKNYQERLELAKFFIRNSEKVEATEILTEIIQESETMTKPSYRQNRVIIKKTKELLTTLA